MIRHRLLEIVLYVDDPHAAARFLVATADVALVAEGMDTLELAASGIRLLLLPRPLARRTHDGGLAAAEPGPGELVFDASDPGESLAGALAAGARTRMEERSLPHGRAASVEAPGGLVVTYYRKTSG